MWFKNARLFQLNENFTMDAEAFSDALKNDALKSCAPMEAVSKGWVSPFGEGSELFVLKSGDAMLFTLGMEEKVLPAAVVNHQLNQQLNSIKSETGQKPGRKQQTDMKQQLMLEMLPQAFVKPKSVSAYIDLKLNLLVVDCASQNAAEDLVSQLRQTLGSFKASAFGPSSSMAQVLTQWVLHAEGAAGFQIDNEIVLETLDDNKGVVRGRNIEHLDDQMKQHIDNGYLVTQLGLEYQQRVELVLAHDMGIKKIKFTDIVLDQLDEATIESEWQMLDSRFTLFSLELRAMLKSLFEVFGSP
ncbi:recombination-associated protein RdgC [Marinicella litoralis]|uniref:Recombination-associated protein RdgC n=1 Tax=Marinicella litoralis TaxID=644220 RepID=A0A4R6Y139_9GAMM|nr:recombination-associated protein RdgC [Marinicella litoralis]TDR23863.1 recombination associated protein RdgC [Marinicella litoralis]